jgi:Cdc6-like AAA superfamily ATPase
MADSDTFTDAYIPGSLPGREGHLKQIRNHLSAALTSRQPSHLWIYGPPGSGKTACVTSTLREIEKARGSYRWVILNCWIDNTLYLLADRISREWRILDGHGMTTVSKLHAIKKFMSDKPVIVVLDEVDKLAPGERNKVLYNLAALGRISLICISNNADGAWELEERILSRLSPATMHFESYTAPEIMRILSGRSECAHHSAEAIERVAHLAGGDMRVALRLLKNAIQIAQRDQSALSREHVDVAFRGKQKPDAWRLAKMGEHDQFIYHLIQVSAGIRSGDLRKAYLELCQKKQVEAIAERTFLKSLQRLKDARLIRWTWISGPGRARAFRVQAGQTG